MCLEDLYIKFCDWRKWTPDSEFQVKFNAILEGSSWDYDENVTCFYHEQLKNRNTGVTNDEIYHPKFCALAICRKAW